MEFLTQESSHYNNILDKLYNCISILGSEGDTLVSEISKSNSAMSSFVYFMKTFLSKERFVANNVFFLKYLDEVHAYEFQKVFNSELIFFIPIEIYDEIKKYTIVFPNPEKVIFLASFNTEDIKLRLEKIIKYWWNEDFWTNYAISILDENVNRLMKAMAILDDDKIDKIDEIKNFNLLCMRSLNLRQIMVDMKTASEAAKTRHEITHQFINRSRNSQLEFRLRNDYFLQGPSRNCKGKDDDDNEEESTSRVVTDYHHYSEPSNLFDSDEEENNNNDYSDEELNDDMYNLNLKN